MIAIIYIYVDEGYTIQTVKTYLLQLSLFIQMSSFKLRHAGVKNQKTMYWNNFIIFPTKQVFDLSCNLS